MGCLSKDEIFGFRGRRAQLNRAEAQTGSEAVRVTNSTTVSVDLLTLAFCCNGFEQVAASERSEQGRYLEAVVNSNAKLGADHALEFFSLSILRPIMSQKSKKSLRVRRSSGASLVLVTSSCTYDGSQT